jgi:lipopolysaccharide export system permease protein
MEGARADAICPLGPGALAPSLTGTPQSAALKNLVNGLSRAEYAGMRLLDRYLLRELLVPLAFCMGGFLIFYVAFDLIFGIKAFLDKQLTPGDIVDYYLATLPELLVIQVIPVSLLLALLYSLTNLNRYQELTAMRAAGVGLWRMSLPDFGVGALLGLAVLALNELLVPPSADRAREILQRHDPNREDLNWAVQLNFHNDLEDRDWSIDRYNRATAEMKGARIVWKQADGSTRAIHAARGIYSNGKWVFYNVEDWLTPAASPSNPRPLYSQTARAVLELAFSETPAWINIGLKAKAVSPTEAAKKPQLSIREILAYLRLNPHLDKVDRAKLMTQFQCRLAEPFTCLAVVLIALPFGARSGRHNVFAGVATSVFICFGYFIMQRISLGFGVGGHLPPILAAWLPNLVFGLTGLVMIRQAQ